MSSHHPRILIVGAGCFGISTAYHLLKRGYTDVTVLDRSSILPAPDAASTDINKIVRSSYSDPFYAKLGKEAIESWKRDLPGIYHESGVLVLSRTNMDKVSYVTKSYENDHAMGCDVKLTPEASSIRACFASQVDIGSFDGISGYINADGGWAFAAEGVRKMIEKVREMKGNVIPGKAVDRLIRSGGRTVGVSCKDGSQFHADLVVLATGSWTASSFQADLDLKNEFIATGQSLATIQLTSEEAERYKDCPVVLDVSSGFYIFPPTADHVIKAAIHDSGYTRATPLHSSPAIAVSTPRTITSHPEDGYRIPVEMVQRLRKHLTEIYPELGSKPFSATRLCWYNDSPDDDWIIARYPSDENVVIATAGSGHAYKFLPVIGSLIVDIIEGKASPEIISKFSLGRAVPASVLWGRASHIKELDELKLCTDQDLQAPTS